MIRHTVVAAHGWRRGPAGRVRPGLVAFLHQVALVAGAMLAYFGIRNLTVGSAADAFANAKRLLEFEQALNMAWEEAGQAAVVGSDVAVMLLNWVYIWGHWPVILTSAVALYLLRRHDYYVLRDALFISGAVGFVLFALLPVAPPRMLDAGFVDTVTEQSNAYRALQPPGLTNQYAAFPSLHLGWNLLLGVVLYHATRRLLVRLFAVGSPLAMAAAVVLTANHFIIDVVAGAVLVLIALWVSRRLHPAPDQGASPQLP
ncbi:MAG: phosphatase PAP2 family protein [Gaiella sp.]